MEEKEEWEDCEHLTLKCMWKDCKKCGHYHRKRNVQKKE